MPIHKGFVGTTEFPIFFIILSTKGGSSCRTFIDISFHSLHERPLFHFDWNQRHLPCDPIGSTPHWRRRRRRQCLPSVARDTSVRLYGNLIRLSMFPELRVYDRQKGIHHWGQEFPLPIGLLQRHNFPKTASRNC